MIWAVVVTLIVSVALNVLFAVLVSRQSTQTSVVLDRSHARTVEYTGELIDRLMAVDYLEFHANRNVYSVPVEEDEDSPEVELVPTLGPDRGGFGSRHGLRGWAAEDDAINPEDDMP